MFDRQKLANFLKANGMTKSDLARKLMVSEGIVRHIITGIKQPSLSMACEIADIMGCTVDDLRVKDEDVD